MITWSYGMDLINLAGILFSIVGFFYVTFDLLKRERLRVLTRFLTPALIGGIFLAPFGLLDYALAGSTNPELLPGGILFGLVGVMIGLFNGIFVRWIPDENKSALQAFLEWLKKQQWVQKWSSLSHWICTRIVILSEQRRRHSEKNLANEVNKPPVFSWGDGLVGLIIVFPLWCLALSFQPSLSVAQDFVLGIVLALIGGIAAGLWRFINWEPPSLASKLSPLSWGGCLIGLAATSLLGYIVLYRPSHTHTQALISVLFLALSGAIAGILWRNSGFTGHLCSFVSRLRRHTTAKPSAATDQPTIAPVDTMPATSDDKSSTVPGNELSPSSSKGDLIEPKPPFFSRKGCFIGLIAASVFGFASALLANMLSGSTFTISVRGALSATSFIGLAGAITGGVSRYIFDWAVSLKEGDLILIGGVTTLFGFALVGLPPVLHLLGIAGQ